MLCKDHLDILTLFMAPKAKCKPVCHLIEWLSVFSKSNKDEEKCASGFSNIWRIWYKDAHHSWWSTEGINSWARRFWDMIMRLDLIRTGNVWPYGSLNSCDARKTRLVILSSEITITFGCLSGGNHNGFWATLIEPSFFISWFSFLM